MRPDAVEILHRGYELIWREDDADPAFRGEAPDFEWVGPEHPEGELRRGAGGADEFFREWTEPCEELHMDWELHRAGPDRVLAVLRMHGRGRDSGAPVEMLLEQVWTFQEGRSARMVMYTELEKAFEAAGLLE
ncbi:MAG: nuclear transport factor 2 family protein [Thermoleophilaceae bacterium]|nr:nuclear transport factor 2 family protein [Thermoleophilaceae bacterium]